MSEDLRGFAVHVLPHRVEEVPRGYNKYEMRHPESDWSIPCSVETKVWCNFWGTLITRADLNLTDEKGSYMELTQYEGEDLAGVEQSVKCPIETYTCSVCGRQEEEVVCVNKYIDSSEYVCKRCIEKSHEDFEG